tara:strand:- start:1003 stop:1443 length:441 start_codon:yes stop_codon:yes gene_type:complete
MYVAGAATNEGILFSIFRNREYPDWNPLNRSGEPINFSQILHLANPISNLTILISLLFGIKNIALSFSIYIFTLITLYVLGVYYLLLSLTRNQYAATFGALLSLCSAPSFWIAYSDILIKLLRAVQEGKAPDVDPNIYVLMFRKNG